MCLFKDVLNKCLPPDKCPTPFPLRSDLFVFSSKLFSEVEAASSSLVPTVSVVADLPPAVLETPST